MIGTLDTFGQLMRFEGMRIWSGAGSYAGISNWVISYEQDTSPPACAYTNNNRGPEIFAAVFYVSFK